MKLETDTYVTEILDKRELLYDVVVNRVHNEEQDPKPDTRTEPRSIGVLRVPVVNFENGTNLDYDYPRSLIEIEFMRHEAAMDRLGKNWTSNLERFAQAIVDTVITYFADRISEVQ